MTGAFPQIAESQFDLRSGRLTIPPRERGSCPVVGQTVSHYRILAGWPSFSRSLRKGRLMGIIGAPRDKGPFTSQREVPSGRRPWNPTFKKEASDLTPKEI